MIGAIKNNQTKIRTMYFFLSWFVWFGLFALSHKKETHSELVGLTLQKRFWFPKLFEAKRLVLRHRSKGEGRPANVHIA